MTAADDTTDHGDDTGADVRTDVEPASGAAFSSEADDASIDVDEAAPRPGSSIGFSIVVAAIVLALDQLTKHWAVNALSDGASRHVFWKLHWNLAFNSGMAFSRAQGVGPYIGALALVVVIVMVLSLRKVTGRGSAVAVGLVVGGACGNLTDRLFRGDGWLHGSVVDFIDFEFWPIFNIADMGVSIGGVLIVLTALTDGGSGRGSGRGRSKVGGR